MSTVSEIRTMWQAWSSAPFPDGYTGEDVDDIGLVLLDLETAGCIDDFVSCGCILNPEDVDFLRKCERSLDTVTAKLDGEAKLYFGGLLQVTRMVLRTAGY